MKVYLFLLPLFIYKEVVIAKNLKINDLLKISREEDSEHRVSIAEKMAEHESMKQLDQYYEPLWQSKIFHDSDQLLTQQRFSVNPISSLTTSGVDTKWTKRTAYGTEIYTQLEVQKIHSFWPQGSQIKSNKSYVSVGKVGIQQPFLKDYLSKNISLQKENIKNKIYQKSILREIKNQQKQSQLEQIYWQASSFKSQISISIEKENLFNEYIALIKKRQVLGLADDVALAEAIMQQLSAKSLKMQRQHDFERAWEQFLKIGEFPSSLEKHDVFWDPFLKNDHELFLSDHDFLKESLLQSLSIQNLEALRNSQKIQLELIREQHKPDLRLGMESSIGGQGTSIADSVQNLKHQSTLYLSLNIPLHGQTKYSQNQGVQFQMKAISEKENSLRHQIIEEAKQMISEQKRLTQQIELIQENLTALKNLKKAEQKKISQARSDRVLIIRYEIDALNLKSQVIYLKAEKYKTLSKMRLFINAYPKGVETL